VAEAKLHKTCLENQATKDKATNSKDKAMKVKKVRKVGRKANRVKRLRLHQLLQHLP
jgi:hypothetical protein